MSKKFSIAVSIDLERIDEEIYKYVEQNDNLQPYLFMNEETANAVEATTMSNLIFFNNSSSAKKHIKNGVYAEYTGYKVFINNDLRFGIVEIR